MKVEWSPRALERVAEIADYIARDQPPAAERWVGDLFESVARLESHPRSGRRVPEVGIERIREIIFGAYRIIYGIDEPAQKVSVLTVRRGSELLRTEEFEPGEP